MSKSATSAAPPDQAQRERALDPARSVLVQAPAGSGKTTLLTERFLTLLAEVDDPGQVVAITFTIAAAAEMRNRILDELRAAEPTPKARGVLDRSNALGWKLLDLPAQLRISTIDSFCRELALQQPLLSGFGGGLAVAEQPEELYRRAARRTLQQIAGSSSPEITAAVESLLDWRDNNWQELENQLVTMLSQRDRWMQDFVLSQTPDWSLLRQRLELPFVHAVRQALTKIGLLLDQVPSACDEALLLARFACTQPNGEQHRALAELVEFPNSPFLTIDELEEAHHALLCLANLVLTKTYTLRKSIDKNHGFPADRKAEKARLTDLIARLNAVPGLEDALAAVPCLPPARYSEADWLIVRACFTLLRHAVAQLKVVFAESAAVDFIEVAQIAQSVLQSDDGSPSDAAFALAEGIRHLLIDEFQDTSRRQHQLLARLIAAWPDRDSRTLFLVGDPMQSIYFFRDADAELFQRVKEVGLEIPNAEPLLPDFVPLSANFRTTPQLVLQLNEIFEKVFASDDGSGIGFSAAVPARASRPSREIDFKLHLDFIPQVPVDKPPVQSDPAMQEDPASSQVSEIVSLVRSFQPAMDEARQSAGKFRIAVLARTRKSLIPIAAALREAAIPFRAVELERLSTRPEVLDALALARALLNPHDRLAWLSVLRAPWSGLGLRDLYVLTSEDDAQLLSRPVPDLLAERLPLLSDVGCHAVQRLISALDSMPAKRNRQPIASLGTWLQQIWIGLGGPDCCDATAHANLDLLWNCLDSLPSGQQDLLGPALDAALDKLTALPDPEASTDCGVQLMTIHKSKGLEFEIVVVPDLQAKDGASSPKMLSWLERGLNPEANELDTAQQDEITEFLIAPLPLKGTDRGKAKAWVDAEYKKREGQETRRILYVAATRARDQLHLFARPACKADGNGDLSLANPSTGLLATAWPAFEEEIRTRFEEWNSARKRTLQAQPPSEIASLAASADSNLLVMPSNGSTSPRPTLLRRLPLDYTIATPGHAHLNAAPDTSLERLTSPSAQSRPRDLYARHEGGLLSRALGTAVHALLQELARLRTAEEWPASRAALKTYEPSIAAQVRAAGTTQRQAEELAAQALQAALDVSHDPAGQWVLCPHPQAASEIRWSGVMAGSVRTVQADRVFQAGLTPQSDGTQAWWIIDYKSHANRADVAPAIALPKLRNLFAPQLEAYAAVLRNLHGADTVIRAGLYYPRMLLFDWWAL